MSLKDTILGVNDTNLCISGNCVCVGDYSYCTARIHMTDRKIPVKYEIMYNKRKSSRKQAIRFFCIECMGYDSKEVDECSDKGCSLWSWRKEG